MENISVRIDLYIEEFEMLGKHPDLPLPLQDRFLNLHLDLRFLKLFSRFTTECAAGDAQDANLVSIRINIEALLQEHEATDEEWENLALDVFHHLEIMASGVIQTVENLKEKIKEFCHDLWDCYSLDAISGTSEQITEFLDLVLWNLMDFVNRKDDLTPPVKNQIKVLQEKLCFIGNVFDFTAKRCPDQQKLEEFWRFMQGIMNYASCLSILYWTDTKEENQVARLDAMLSDLLRKFKPHNPMVIEMYFGVLLPSKSSQFGKFMIGGIVTSLCDLLLEDLAAPVKDRLKFFREGLIFLTTFLMNPPEKPDTEAGGVLYTRIDDIISFVVSFICAFYRDDTEMCIQYEGRDIFLVLLVEIDKVMAEIEEFYVQVPNFSDANFPVTNGIGFLDCLLGNLKEMMKSQASKIPFATVKILSVQEDLLSLQGFIKDVAELKNEQEEFKDLWKGIIDVAYYADRLVNSCLIVGNPIWYDILSLSRVAEKIKVLKTEVQKVTDLETWKVRKPDEGYHWGPLLPRQGNTSRVDQDVVVGFKDEMETITDRLTRGTTQLDIISIVGMPGQGKTTLAKQVYNDPSIKYHFHKCAWCNVSQIYQMKELLLDILRDVTGVDIRTSNPRACEDELAEWLWKSLKGRRFLIVMDDIWDIGAWDGIRRLLPDDGIGSRIVFTSQIHNLVLQANPSCNPHPIRLFNDEESWELLQKRVFDNDGCPSELSEIGMKIARKCNGLPLSVVLIAGILARMDKNLDSWEEIMESMGLHIATEGCMDLVQLSYNHLPDCLRPCFLYFSAFPEAKLIRVQKLIKLWTAEGFVPRNDVKRLEDTAGEYLMDLIGRSLVIAAARSSKGEVKACRVHDLLHEFCLTKAKEEKFLQKILTGDISDDSPQGFEMYRLFIDNKWKQFIHSRPAGNYVHSLVVSGGRIEWGGESRLTSFFLGFKFLHVLDMECLYIDNFFPKEIILMVHLRYLAIWCCTNYLPSSIADLWKLETLIVKSARLYSIPLPASIWTMKTLRHIDIPTMTFNEYQTDESCQLHNVVTLSTPTLTSSKDTEELLRRLPLLRKLKCNFLEIKLDSEDSFQFPALTCLTQLESLSVYNGGDMIYGENQDIFPSFDLPDTLRKLTLEFFHLTRSAMSMIGMLPNLQVLKVRQSGFFDQRWDLEDGEFLSLKFLELSNVQLQHWNDCDEPFPCLEHLFLQSCCSLEEIPPSFGVIPTLKRMDVYWCPKASSSAIDIVREQMDMGNDDIELCIIEE